MSNRRVLLLADGYTSEGAKAVCLMNEYVAGYYTIDGEDSLGSYNTIPDWADGFGPLGETAPWINYLVMETSWGGMKTLPDALGFSFPDASETDDADMQRLRQEFTEKVVIPLK